MAGTLQGLIASLGKGPLAGWFVQLVSASASGGVTATLTLNSNGTQSAVQPGLSSLSPNWYLPTTAGAGNNYWCRLTTVVGPAPSSGSGTGILALSANRAWNLFCPGGTIFNTSKWKLEIAADAAMAGVIASWTFDVQANGL
jgi:hypothetical protein